MTFFQERTQKYKEEQHQTKMKEKKEKNHTKSYPTIYTQHLKRNALPDAAKKEIPHLASNQLSIIRSLYYKRMEKAFS